jgi:hypothetical protein
MEKAGGEAEAESLFVMIIKGFLLNEGGLEILHEKR